MNSSEQFQQMGAEAPGGTGPAAGTAPDSSGGRPGRTQPGFPQNAAQGFDPRSKSPALACVLSLMPGLGQIYIGYYTRGFVHIVVVATLITILANDPGPLAPLFGLFLAFFWLYNVVDAGRRAAFYNQALRGALPMDLPKDLTLPTAGGSILGGLALVGAGALLLARTRFDVSLVWLREWWPLVPILAGVYLLVQGIRSRAAKE